MNNLTLKLQIIFLTQIKIRKNKFLLFFVIFLTMSNSYGQGVSTGYFTSFPTSEKLCSTSNNKIFLRLQAFSSGSLVYNLTLNTQIQIGSTTSNNFLSLNPAPDCFAGGAGGTDILSISNVVANNVSIGNLSINQLSSSSGTYDYELIVPKTNSNIILEIEIEYNLKFDCSIIPSLSNQTLFLNQQWQVSLPIPAINFSFNSGYYPFDYGSIGTASSIANIPANNGQTSVVYFEYSNAGGSLNLDFEFQDATSCSPLPYTVNSKTYAVGNLATSNTNLSYIANVNSGFSNTTTINNGQKLVIKVEFFFTSCISQCPQASFEFRWKCAGAPASFCNPCQFNPYLTTVIWATEPLKYEVVRLEPSGPFADFDNSCNQDNFHWKAEIINTSSFTEINNLTLELSYPNSGIERMVFIDETTISVLPSSGSNAVVSAPIKLSNVTSNNCFTTDVYNFSFTVNDLDPNESVILEFYTKRCFNDDPILFNINKIFNQWTFSSNCLDACGNTVYPTVNQLGVFNTITTASGGISSHSNSPNFDIDHLHLASIFPPSNQITSQPVAPLGPSTQSFAVSTTCYDLPLNNFVGDDFDYQLLGNSDLTSLPNGIFGVLRAEIEILNDGLIIENHPGDIVLSYNGIDYTGDCYNTFNNTTNNQVNTRVACQPGIYYTYFNLQSITDVVDLLNNGSLKFCLLGCCSGNNRANTNYEIRFSLLPNDAAGSCFNFMAPVQIDQPPIINGQNTWIPLSEFSRYIQVHCPGCIAPGLIIKDYRIQRTTLGFEDSNDDNIADNTNVINSAYLATHPFVETSTATHGDIVQDFLTAHFQDGDMTIVPSGYTYSYMNNGTNVSKLTNLQFLLKVPYGDVNAMNLEIIGFDFYLDDPNATPCATCCEDCDLFPATNAGIATSFEMHYQSQNIGQIAPFLQRAGENYLFTIDESYLTSPSVINDVTYTSHYPFIGFTPNQYYRLSVRYRVSGNLQTFLLSNTSSQVASSISSQGWLTGNNPATVSGNSVIGINPAMPQELNQLPQPLPLSQSFADTRTFWCEFNGTNFNFISSDYFSSAIYSIGTGGYCEDYIQATAIVGFNKTEISFRDEYKSAPIIPESFVIKVPAGYEYSNSGSNPYLITLYWSKFDPQNPTIPKPIAEGFYSHKCDITSFLPPRINCGSDQFIDLNIKDIVSALQLPNPNSFSCKVAGTVQNELILGDGKTFIILTIPIQPCDCNSAPSSTASGGNTSVITFVDKEDALLFCQPISGVLPSFSEIKNNENYSKTIYKQNPNLQVTIVPLPVQVNQTNVCWNITVANPNLTGQNPPISHAPNVFLQLPTVNYLNNWTLNLTNQANSTSIVGALGSSIISSPPQVPVQVMTIEPNLKIGTTLTGLLCADYSPCQNDVDFNIGWGWNCEGFPSLVLPVNEVCEVETINPPLNIVDAPSELKYNFTASGAQPTTYDLCGTVAVKTCFISSANGQIQPFNLALLGGNIQGLILPPTITISNCSGTGSATLALNTGTNSYPISISDLNAIGIVDDFLDLNECICFDIVYTTNCDYFGQLPEIEVQALSYCGSIINSKFANSSLTFSGISNCTIQGPSCIRIEKRIAPNNNPCEWVTAGEPFAYEIEIWNFSGGPSVILDDNLAGACFTQTSANTFPVTLPISFGAMHLETITGYFHNGCAPISTNTATVTDINQTSWSSSVNVNVEDNCSGVGVFSFRDVLITDVLTVLNNPPNNVMTPNNVISNLTFDFAGIIQIDEDVIFDNCTIFMEPGSEIIVNPTKILSLRNNSLLEACTRMWKGIVLEQESKVVLHNSILRDAEVAILLNESTSFDIFDSDIENCVENILARPVTGSPVSFISLRPSRISATRIGMTTAFKLPYCNQAPFDDLPVSAIELNDIRNSFVIGNSAASENHFFNMTSGVILRNCTSAEIVNTRFSDMYRSSDNIKIDPEIAVAVYAKGISAYGHKLTISPLTITTNVSMSKASIGVLLDEMDGAIINQKMDLLDQGIYIKNMKFPQQLDIKNCTITPKKSGIELENNNGAAHFNKKRNPDVLGHV